MSLQPLDEFFLIELISGALETDTKVDSQWSHVNQEQSQLNIGCILNDIHYNKSFEFLKSLQASIGVH